MLNDGRWKHQPLSLPYVSVIDLLIGTLIQPSAHQALEGSPHLD